MNLEIKINLDFSNRNSSVCKRETDYSDQKYPFSVLLYARKDVSTTQLNA